MSNSGSLLYKKSPSKVHDQETRLKIKDKVKLKSKVMVDVTYDKSNLGDEELGSSVKVSPSLIKTQPPNVDMY